VHTAAIHRHGDACGEEPLQITIRHWDEWNGRLDWVISTGVVILSEYPDGAIYCSAVQLPGKEPVTLLCTAPAHRLLPEVPGIVLARTEQVYELLSSHPEA